MTQELVLYTHPMSRGRMARWMLEEIGQPYRTEIVEFGPAMRDPAYLAINPMGKVPALRHGETIVCEVSAIVTYLADAFPGAGLAPAPDAPERGAYLKWLFFAAGPLETTILDRAMGRDIPPEREGLCGYGSYARLAGVLEAALSGRDTLLDTGFSAADLYLGGQLGFGMLFGAIEKRPAFVSYVQGLHERPAARRADELDGPMPPPRRKAD